MNRIILKRILPVVVLLFITLVTHAQDANKQTDFMRSNGRSYVVIAVMLTILAGLLLYMTRLERKLRKLEKEN